MLTFRFILFLGGPSVIGLYTFIFKKAHYFSYMVHCCSTLFNCVLHALFKLKSETSHLSIFNESCTCALLNRQDAANQRPAR